MAELLYAPISKPASSPEQHTDRIKKKEEAFVENDDYYDNDDGVTTYQLKWQQEHRPTKKEDNWCSC